MELWLKAPPTLHLVSALPPSTPSTPPSIRAAYDPVREFRPSSGGANPLVLFAHPSCPSVGEGTGPLAGPSPSRSRWHGGTAGPRALLPRDVQTLPGTTSCRPVQGPRVMVDLIAGTRTLVLSGARPAVREGRQFARPGRTHAKRSRRCPTCRQLPKPCRATTSPTGTARRDRRACRGPLLPGSMPRSSVRSKRPSCARDSSARRSNRSVARRRNSATTSGARW